MSGVKAFGAEVINQIMHDCVISGSCRSHGGANEVMLEEVAKRSYIE